MAQKKINFITIERFMMKFFLIASVFILTGCLHEFEEIHYFSVANNNESGKVEIVTINDEQADIKTIPNGLNRNYFKTTISGSTLFSESNFRAGWFDSNALSTLFSSKNDRTNNSSPNPKTDKDANHKEYALILDSNAGAIVNVIQSIAQDRETSNVLKKIAADKIGKETNDKILAENKALNKYILQKERLLDILNGYMVASKKDGADLQFELLKILNETAMELDGASFTKDEIDSEKFSTWHNTWKQLLIKETLE